MRSHFRNPPIGERSPVATRPRLLTVTAMAERSPIEAVVFDIGGVLVEWDPRHLYRSLLSEHEMEAFLGEICTLEWHAQHDRGVPFADSALELSARHPEHEALIRAWGERWDEMIPGSYPGTVAIVHELHRTGIVLAGLTNWPAETFPRAVERFPFLGLLDPIVVSGREGIAKPDPALFRILIERASLDPLRTVYIDDAPANVTAASDLGFVALHYRTATDLRSELVGMGLLAR